MTPAVPESRFRRLARTHALMAAGDAAMTVALADSVLFNISPDAARSRVLLFLGISFVPFLFVAPLIGPAIDRMAGGRRLVIQIVAVVRIVLSVLLAFNVDNLLLFPLAFASLVCQKAYAVSKSALVPSVVRTEHELVEANSKLGLISGIIGAVAIIPAAGLQRLVGPWSTLLYSGLAFALALVAATRLPREVVAARRAGRTEQEELGSAGVVLAASAMLVVRASVGFCFFHLFFWFRRQDAGLVWFGLSLAFAAIATTAGNAAAPAIRHRVREETMLIGALAVCAVAGVGTALLGGVLAGVLLAGSVNMSAAIGRLAFDSIVQRDAPDANQGRAFAQFETRFQLGWVGAGVLPVLLRIPGELGFAMVGVLAAFAMVSYRLGSAAIADGRPHPLRRRRRTAGDSATTAVPRPPGASRTAEVERAPRPSRSARRRGPDPTRPITPDPRRRGTLPPPTGGGRGAALPPPPRRPE